MANQLAIALTVAAMILLLAPARGVMACLLAAAAAVTYLVHPLPGYWHSMVYSADQAVLIYIALALLCEALIRTSPAPRPRLHWLQAFLLTLGTTMDWLAAFVAGSMFLLRLLSPLGGKWRFAQVRREFALLCLGCIAVMLFWLWQVHISDALNNALQRLHVRTTNPMREWWPRINNLSLLLRKGHFPKEEGYALYAALAWFTARFLWNRRDTSACIALILFIAYMTHTFVFMEHATWHTFSALKYMTVLTLLCYGLMPLQIIGLADRWRHPLVRLLQWLVLAGFLLWWGQFQMTQQKEWQSWHGYDTIYHEDTARWLRENAGYNDVFFSKTMEVETPPITSPHLISRARKMVRRYHSEKKLRAAIDKLPPQARLWAILQDSDLEVCDVAGDKPVATIPVHGLFYHVFSFGPPPLDERWIACITTHKKPKP